MLSKIKNSIFIKCLWGLIGLHLLNISVDSKDPNPEHIPEDLSFNDQESIIEIVVEKVLGFEDAIKEYDDHDTEDHNKKTNVKIDLTTHSIVANTLNPLIFETARHKFPNYKAHLTTGFNKLNLPPPKI
ncbi:hypothetical protein APS56_00125 [Pseudalgibacter alginicilyticus]|uniref:Uncharacterized protein n=1 Tax=Pseudalgibacter alginicilyticus TaxID=1736674 RepID=A0A0P0D1M2_9FLAO|nr:hypothetical protein [Pseudalgibacter alginicilyticus]ALJ03648.1 hypothetical protein APS56_00125 [Pseudalgibacter alginicilyticus]